MVLECLSRGEAVYGWEGIQFNSAACAYLEPRSKQSGSLQGLEFGRASQIRTKGHLYDALSHLRLCFIPHSYLISYFRNGRNLFRCLLILYLDPSACKATISLCCERRLHSAGKRRRQDTVGNIILDTITVSKQHFCESQRQNLSIESSWSKSKMALLFGKT